MPEFLPKFIISSHVSSFEKAVPKLVKSLIKSGVDKSNIIVVVGGADECKEKLSNGVKTHYVNHNSYDHTGLIFLLESDEDHEWWWSMHDTTEVGPGFYQKIIKYGAKNEHVSVGEEGWLNMGLFSIKFLKRIRHYVLSLKNCSKLSAILSERVYPRLTRSSSYSSAGDFIFLDHRNVYSDGVIRRVIYYEAIDLYKYQSFYLEKQQTLEYLKNQEIDRKFRLEKSM